MTAHRDYGHSNWNSRVHCMGCLKGVHGLCTRRFRYLRDDLDKQGDNKFAIIYQQAASMKKTKQSTANPIPTPTNAAQQT